MCHWYADPFSKNCSNCSVIQSVWLYNILVLVHYRKTNTSIQKRANVLKVKVTMTQKWSILPVQYLGIFAMIRLLTSYSKDKRGKEAKYWYLSRKVKGQHSCNSLVTLSFWRNISTPLNHRCIHLCKQMKDDDLKTSRTSKDKQVIGQNQ